MPEIKHGTEEVTRYVMIVDSTTGAPETEIDVTTLDMQYTRAGAAPAAKADAGSLGATNAAWDDNEIFEVDKTSSPGLYRVDWPNAAFAAGVDSVILVVSGTGFAPAVEEITLIANRADDVATTIGAAGAGLTAVVWNADWDAEVESECEDALEAMNLDHLLKVAHGDQVVDDSVIAMLAAKGATADWSDYVNTTDSLQAIRDKETDIETDTAVIGALGAGLSAIPWNAAWDAEVESECADALAAINLDHLLKVAAGDEVVDDSVIGQMTATDGDWSNFAKATDSLQSIRDKETDIETDTAVIGALGAGLTAIPWNAAWDAEVESECADALAAINLDHLLKVAAGDEVVDDSVIGQMTATDGDWSNFAKATDSLQSIRDKETDIETDTAVIGALGAGLTALPWNSAWDAEIESECADALAAINLDHLLKVADGDDVTNDSIIGHMTATDGDWSNFAKATDSLQAIRDRGDAAWATGAGGTGLNRLRSGTAQAGAAGTITLDAAASATSSLYIGARVLLTGGTGEGQSRLITAYDGATKIATVHRNWVTNPANDSVFEIQAADVEVGTWTGTAVTLSGSLPDVNVEAEDNIDFGALKKASLAVVTDKSLTDINLDHLLAVADGDDVVDDSIIAHLAAKGATADWSTFVNTTDSLQAVRDNQGVSTIFQGTSTASSTTSKVYVQAGDTPATGADDDYNNTLIVVYDGADKTTARVNVRCVTDYDDSDPSFTVSPVLAFTPGAGDVVEVYVADAAALAMLNALSSGFAATSPNRLIDHLRSIMSKAAVTPASVGTYNPATDSLEHLGESADLMAGAGFATGTDSLKEIRDAIDVLVAPSVVGSSALSGSGFLSDCVSLIRKAVDEPSANPKYTDGDIVELLQVAIDQVLTDIAIATDHPIIVRHNITLVDGVQDYILPPQVGELLRISKMNTTTGTPEYEEYPGSYHNPSGSGWKIEGNTLRLLRDFNSTDTLELMYTPNAEPLIHKGTSEGTTATTVTLMATPTDGTLGTRPNEYVGMTLRILSSTQNYKEERVITAYDVSTRIATVHKAWDTTPTGTVVYEVVPVFGRLVKHVCSLRAAIDLLANEGNQQRMATLERNYLLKMTAMRRAISKKENRFPHHFDGDTWDNTNRLGY